MDIRPAVLKFRTIHPSLLVDELVSDRSGIEIVREAMEHPIDSPRLCELAAGRPDCVIIISDHTRPVPSQDILPVMIGELRAGNPDIDITLLVATGFHRGTTTEELRAKLVHYFLINYT